MGRVSSFSSCPPAARGTVDRRRRRQGRVSAGHGSLRGERVGGCAERQTFVMDQGPSVQMERLMAMGYPANMCRKALAETGNHVEVREQLLPDLRSQSVPLGFPNPHPCPRSLCRPQSAAEFIMLNIDKGDQFWGTAPPPAAAVSPAASPGLSADAVQAALAQMAAAGFPSTASPIQPQQAAAAAATAAAAPPVASPPLAAGGGLSADAISAALSALASPEAVGQQPLGGGGGVDLAAAMRQLAALAPTLSGGGGASAAAASGGRPRAATNKRPRSVDRYEAETVAGMASIFEVSLTGDSIGTQEIERAIGRRLETAKADGKAGQPGSPVAGLMYLADCFGRANSGSGNQASGPGSAVDVSTEMLLFLAR